MVRVNLGSTDDSRYTGYREITDRDVLDLQCIHIFFFQGGLTYIVTNLPVFCFFLLQTMASWYLMAIVDWGEGTSVFSENTVLVLMLVSRP